MVARVAAAGAVLTIGALRAAEPEAPVVAVPGLEVSLFAAEPEIVTPVGVAVDAKGRVFVVESHTHQVRPGYNGPSSDRVRILEDRDGDGRAEAGRTFAEGFRSAMNLAFDEAGVLHLVHRNGVVRLEDTDGDDVCDRQVTLLHLVTEGDYPHNGLSGIAFSPDGWIYVGTGENLGIAYTATGADGREIPFTPGGANVFRVRRDGSQLELVATGMWNMFSLAVDGEGRLFGVDNDPDSRPPCRLLHIVPGGDYGYRFHYGRSGLHPFVCWNGELPGTLPMVAGTGEAPTGILDARFARLGAGRGAGMLVTEWGDCRVSLYRLSPAGASFTASAEVILSGSAGFRPACLAAAPDGSVYITDWADREYPVHGKGRIWRLRAKDPSGTPENDRSLPVTGPETKMAKLVAAGEPAEGPGLRAALLDQDPFIRSAAVEALTRPVFRDHLLRETEASEPAVRLGVLLALRRAEADLPETAAGFLGDPDPEVRMMAMMWIAERRWTSLHERVAGALRGVETSPQLVRTWLAALDLLERPAPPTAESVPVSQDRRVMEILTDPDAVPAVQAAAIPLLARVTREAADALLRLLSGPDERTARAAARALAGAPGDEVTNALVEAAIDQWTPAALRLDAIAALTNRGPEAAERLIPLLEDESPAVARETARTLRAVAGHPPVREALTRIAESSDADPELRSQAALALGLPPVLPRPSTDEQWHLALQGKGDPDAGRRVFFSAAALCSTCHRAEGRGAAVGPDLDLIARSSDRDRLIDAILSPSRDIAPQYALKLVHLKSGERISGIAAPRDGGGNITLLQNGGVSVFVDREQIARVEEPPVSLMPDGLELQLTVQDLRDLLAWMLRLK